MLVPELVAALAAKEPARPRLTWYGPGAERAELSGRVLTNAVVKATNLLLDEAEARPGVRVVLELPAHWRTPIWALAAWTTGAEVCLARQPGADVLVTAHPPRRLDTHAPGVVVAVPLAPLALRYPEPLGPGVLDGAADLMTYPDALGWLPPSEPARPALDAAPAGGEPPVSHADLLTWARATAGADTWPPAPRVLVEARDVLPLLATCLAAWSADGSVVLVGDPSADLSHLAAQERVTP